MTRRFFLKYGKVLTGYDLDGLIAAMDSFEIPDDVIYVASSPELERLPVFQELQNRGFGGVPIQVGYCNGHNKKLTLWNTIGAPRLTWPALI